jgi:phosphoribosylanthranilate isomerase
MKTQIYTMQTPDEALAVIEQGVDFIGLTPANRGLPGEITHEQARAIRDAAHGKATVVALSVENDEDDIVAMVEAVKPDVLHLCGDIAVIDVAAVARIKARIGDTKLMQAVPVGGAESIAIATEFAPLSDYLILDTFSTELNAIGAAGATHDWSVSAAIVEAVDVPVILAGGLKPDNVAEAIAAVQPFAVDSLTHTNERLPGGGFRKDIAAIRAFVEAARSAN